MLEPQTQPSCLAELSDSCLASPGTRQTCTESTAPHDSTLPAPGSSTGAAEHSKHLLEAAPQPQERLVRRVQRPRQSGLRARKQASELQGCCSVSGARLDVYLLAQARNTKEVALALQAALLNEERETTNLTWDNTFRRAAVRAALGEVCAQLRLEQGA